MCNEMSYIKTSHSGCACHAHDVDSGAMTLRMVAAPGAADDAQVHQLAGQVSSEFLGHVSDVTTNGYMGSHHAHFTPGPSHAMLPDMMTQSGGLGHAYLSSAVAMRQNQHLLVHFQPWTMPTRMGA